MEIQHIKSNWLIIYYAHQPNTTQPWTYVLDKAEVYRLTYLFILPLSTITLL